MPIDPSYPEERIRYMLEDCGAEIVLTEQHLLNPIEFNGERLYIEDPSYFEADASNLEAISRSNHLAYVIYTSGTTGTAKGVCIEHKAIVNTLEWRKRDYGFGETDRAIQLFSYAFDGFVLKFFAPILSGSSAIFIQETKNPTAIIEMMETQQVTHLCCVPTLYQAILESLQSGEGQGLRVVTLGGEHVTEQLVEGAGKSLQGLS